jgi:hypothetical protein
MVGNVEFKFIRTVYPRCEKVFCYFYIPNLVDCHPESGDWVGIYKVGWSTLKDYKVRKFIPLESIDMCRKSQAEFATVIFEYSELPKETVGIQYQFVYVTKTNVVRGTSKPFVFEGVVPEVCPLTGCVTGCITEKKPVVSSLFSSLLKPEHMELEMRPEYLIGREIKCVRPTGVQIKETVRPTVLPTETTTTTTTGTTITRTPITTELYEMLHHLIMEQKPTTVSSLETIIPVVIEKVMKPYTRYEELVKLSQELFAENARLSVVLSGKVEEIYELKKQNGELRMVNNDLLCQLCSVEKRIEQLSFEREQYLRRIIETLRPLFVEGKEVHFERIVQTLLPFFERFDRIEGREYSTLERIPSWTSERIGGHVVEGVEKVLPWSFEKRFGQWMERKF